MVTAEAAEGTGGLVGPALVPRPRRAVRDGSAHASGTPRLWLYLVINTLRGKCTCLIN